jgi:cytochrome c biogenesis protein CcmG/thiol:disulfide interchange protein DsbE
LVDLDVSETPRSPSGGRGFLLPVIVVVALGGLLLLLYYGLTTDRLETGIAPPAGTMAPDFQLRTFDGKSIRLSDFRGKPVVVNFWASWCVPCRDEEPALDQLAATYQKQGIVFLGVNMQDTPSDAQTFMRQFQIDYPVVTDSTGAVYINYGVVGVPETYLVNRQGKLVQKITGPVDATTLTPSLEALLR